MVDSAKKTNPSAAQEKTIKVWDPLVRTFHWLLVLAFCTAYISSESFISIHSWAGYLIFSLLCVRLLWGVVGSYHAKFKNFYYRPSISIKYVKSFAGALTRNTSLKHYAGHDPAGAMMIFALLFSLLSTTLSGAMLYGVDQELGPLSTLAINAPLWLPDLLEGTHEFLANLTVTLVVFHVAGVLLSSFLHKESLLRSMINGRKKSRTDYVDRPD